MKTQILYVPFLVLILFLGACVSTQQYQKQFDNPLNLAEKEFQPPEGMARIYVLRKYTFLGSAIGIRITDSGRPVGSIGTSGFLQWDRAPGTVVIGASASNESNVTLAVSAGGVYFIDTRTNWGAGFNSAASELRLIDNDEGMQILKEIRK